MFTRAGRGKILLEKISPQLSFKKGKVLVLGIKRDEKVILFI